MINLAKCQGAIKSMTSMTSMTSSKSMTSLSILTFCLLVQITTANAQIDPKVDWPIWRGPTGNGIAAEQKSVPTRWSSTKSVLWKAKVPGRGHASPTILGDRIFLATADENNKTQSVVAFSKSKGTRLWQTFIHEGSLPEQIHKNNTHASPSVVTDGKHLFVNFYNTKHVEVAVLDLNGNVIIKKKVGGYDPQAYQFGFAPSPVLYKDLIIITSEYEQGWITAFDKKSLAEKWSFPRLQMSFSTPVITRIGGKDQLVISGLSSAISLNPANGRQNWKAKGPWMATCGTAVWDGDVVFMSGGYPGKGTVAVNAATGKQLWVNSRVKCYEQSMLAHDGALYAFADTGVLYCIDVRNGKEIWRGRMSGPVSASPVLADGKLYLTNERGSMWVVEANKNKFNLLSENRLGDETFASPSISQGRIYMRVAHDEAGKRQEYLYCIGS